MPLETGKRQTDRQLYGKIDRQRERDIGKQKVTVREREKEKERLRGGKTAREIVGERK